MLTVCCRICLNNTNFKQVVSLFDTHKGFVIRDALLELFQITIQPTEMLSTICNACLTKVCTVREIRDEFFAQESKYQQILCNSQKDTEEEITTDQSPNDEAEPSPTVESTTEEQDIGDGIKSIETPEISPKIEQENLVINVDDDDDDDDDYGDSILANQMEPSVVMEERNEPLNELQVMYVHERPGKSPELFQITKCTQNEGESEEDIVISQQETKKEKSPCDTDYQFETEDAVESPAATSEIEAGDTNCMYICERCVLCFDTDEAYESHVCAIDEGQTRGNSACKPNDQFQPLQGLKHMYECPHCPNVFEDDAQLLNHNRVQHPNRFKIFPCTVCTEEFATHSALTDHIDSLHPSGYRCKFCNKKVGNSFALKSHENVHTRQKTFSCTVCNRKFAQYTSLWRHMSIHNDIKAYGCDICEKRFRQKSVMLAHRRTHTGEKPYMCEVCPKRFRDHSTLAKHKRVHAKGKN